MAAVGGKEHGGGTLKVGTAGGLATLEGGEQRRKRSARRSCRRQKRGGSSVRAGIVEERETVKKIFCL